MTLPPLESETDYCWRVRTRDAGLLWSGWSTPTPFRTGRATYTGNLIDNPFARLKWTGPQGPTESMPPDIEQAFRLAAGETRAFFERLAELEDDEDEDEEDEGGDEGEDTADEVEPTGASA